MIGEGKYDNVTTHVRKLTDADAVIVIVVNGIMGSGFSMQTIKPTIVRRLPAMLRIMADQIEHDIKHRN